jgi:hypothetical protein
VNGERGGYAVLHRETTLDIPQADADCAAASQRDVGRTRAGVANGDGDATFLAGRFVQGRPHDHVAAQACRCDAMLHRVFHEGLNDQRRHANLPQAGGHVDGDPQPMLEAFALDVQIRFDEIELASERRELALRSQHRAQQRRQAHERLERPRRRCLNEVADGGQRIEQEMRIDLSPERSQLGFTRELADLLLPNFALIAFAGQTDRVDAAGHGDRDGVKRRHIVGQETAAAGQAVDLDGKSGHIRGRHDDRGPIAGHADRSSPVIGPGIRQFVPGDAGCAQGRRQRHADVLQQRRHIVVLLQAAHDLRTQRWVMRPIEHDSVDEPRGDAPQRRIEQRGAHPQGHEHTDLSRVDPRELRKEAGLCIEERERAERDSDDGQQRQGAFEEQVGEREGVVLIQDRERERKRGVVADELDGPRRVASVKLTEVEGGDREDRKRRRPERATKPRLAAGDRGQRHDEKQERVGEQAHAQLRGHWTPGDGEYQMQSGGDSTRDIRDARERAFETVMDAFPFTSQHRVHDDSR